MLNLDDIRSISGKEVLHVRELPQMAIWDQAEIQGQGRSPFRLPLKFKIL